MLSTVKKTGWIGFDVGAAAVKAAQLVRHSGELQLQSAAIVLRRERWTADVFADATPRSSADECSAVLSLGDRFSKAPAASLLPVASCEIMQLNFSSARRDPTRDDLLQAVEAESHRAVEKRIVDSWPIGSDSRKLNVISAPQQWSDQIVADVESARRACRAVDALPWALARAVRLSPEWARVRTLAVLDWGYSRATLCLIVDEAPAYVRVLKDCGFELALAAIQRELRLDQREAEILLAKRTASRRADSATAVVDEVIADPLNHVGQEVRRTLEYWEGLSRGVVPEQLCLFGGGGAAYDGHARLSDGLGLDAAAWRMPLEKTAESSLPGPLCLFGAAAGLSALAWEDQ